MNLIPDVVAIVAVVVIYIELAMGYSPPGSRLRFPVRVLALLLLPFVWLVVQVCDFSDEGEELD